MFVLSALRGHLIQLAIGYLRQRTYPSREGRIVASNEHYRKRPRNLAILFSNFTRSLVSHSQTVSTFQPAALRALNVSTSFLHRAACSALISAPVLSENSIRPELA